VGRNEIGVAIKNILRSFELVSGLRVNLSKSSLKGIRVDYLSMQRYAVMLTCRIMNISFIYLGVPICSNHKRVSFWKGVLDKAKKKLVR